MGSLQTFKMNLKEKDNKKSKGIAFQAGSRDEQIEEPSDEDDDLVESMTILSKKISKSAQQV